LTHPDGGAKCLPLRAMKLCNMHPCAENCVVSSFSGWSKCSAECGGGVRQRLRKVKHPMKYGGDPCPATSESEACNVQSCEKDCELEEWTKWSWCSKDCDGGTRKRERFVKTPAEGAGHCPDEWDPERLQRKECSHHRCVVPAGKEVLQCNRTLDIVLLIDGSGSLGQTGWDAEIKTAQMFVDAFSGTGANSRIAVILYSGPSTWTGVDKCFGKNGQKVNMELDCKIKKVTDDFETDMGSVKTLIGGLTWPQGSTLTSLALQTAKAELALGREEAESVVVTITDGRPLSYLHTWLSSRSVRKSHARLVWVAVTKDAPLKFIKKWATRPWKENVVVVETFEDLEKPDPVNHVIADICPEKHSLD